MHPPTTKTGLKIHTCTEKTSLKKSLEIWRLGKQEFPVTFLVMEQKYKMQSGFNSTKVK